MSHLKPIAADKRRNFVLHVLLLTNLDNVQVYRSLFTTSSEYLCHAIQPAHWCLIAEQALNVRDKWNKVQQFWETFSCIQLL